jgi:two-component system cell cycle sensor histidine kinase/response regulator CckA
MIQDITDRKRDEARIQEQYRFMTDVLESLSHPFYVINAKNYVVEMANSAALQAGISDKAPCYRVTHNRDAPCNGSGHSCPIEEIRKTKRSAIVEHVHYRKDGSLMNVEVHAYPIFDGNGNVVKSIEYNLDITERKRAEKERLRLATAIEQSAENIIITDVEGTIQYVNPAFERTTGYTREEAIGRNPRFLQGENHDVRFYEEMWEALTSGKVWTGHLVNRKKDGTPYDEEATISPVKDASGKLVNYVAVKRDVTNEILLEKQLRQAQKMEAIGTLAGGVAHDFNNLLQVVLGYSDLLLLEKDPQDPDREGLLAIRQAGRDGAGLVKRLLTFSRKVGVKPRPTDLNQGVRRVREMLYRTIPKMIDIELFLADDLKTINADPGQMDQVLLNLAVNARDAMPEGGRLTIQTENVTLDEEYCSTLLDVQPGGYVLMTVSDIGHGMDKDVVEHIFEPFYTTKETGKGTGLGLATVFGIVKSHEGYINCHSKPGAGTTFKIYLPVMESVTEPEVTISTETPALGTETILLVDDDDRVRNLAEKTLTLNGYKVLTAVNGLEALAFYREKKARISLVILDLIMPKMGGNQCLEELLKIDPGLKILVASGYSVNGPTKDALEAGAVGFLSKPFEVEELLRAVRKALDES